MTSDLVTNPQYRLDRAEEIRVLAGRYIHPETKRTLEKLVSDYELLARRAEERLRGRHVSIRPVPRLDQGPQSRQHRRAAGAERDLE